MWRPVRTLHWCPSSVLSNYGNSHARGSKIQKTLITRPAWNISVRAEWLRESGQTPSELSEIPRWQTTPRPARIRRATLNLAVRWHFGCFFSLCRYPIVNEHRSVVVKCDHTSEWGHWVHRQDVTRSESDKQGYISTRHFVYHIRHCYIHKIRYIILWHALFKSLYIYSNGQSSHRW